MRKKSFGIYKAEKRHNGHILKSQHEKKTRFSRQIFFFNIWKVCEEKHCLRKKKKKAVRLHLIGNTLTKKYCQLIISLQDFIHSDHMFQQNGSSSSKCIISTSQILLSFPILKRQISSKIYLSLLFFFSHSCIYKLVSFQYMAILPFKHACVHYLCAYACSCNYACTSDILSIVQQPLHYF